MHSPYSMLRLLIFSQRHKQSTSTPSYGWHGRNLASHCVLDSIVGDSWDYRIKIILHQWQYPSYMISTEIALTIAWFVYDSGEAEIGYMNLLIITKSCTDKTHLPSPTPSRSHNYPASAPNRKLNHARIINNSLLHLYPPSLSLFQHPFLPRISLQSHRAYHSGMHSLLSSLQRPSITQDTYRRREKPNSRARNPPVPSSTM